MAGGRGVERRKSHQAGALENLNLLERRQGPGKETENPAEMEAGLWLARMAGF